MKLGREITFAGLHAHEELAKLDAAFVALLASDIALYHRLMSARAAPETLPAKEASQLMIDLAPHVEDFVASLFSVEAELNALRARHHRLAPLFACKRLFVQRRAAKALSPADAAAQDPRALLAALGLPEGGDLTEWELAFAEKILPLLEAADSPDYHAALHYAAWALYSAKGRERHRHGHLFKQPHKLDFAHLVPVETEVAEGVTRLKLPDARLRPRDGFALTDPRGTLSDALDHAHYCIYCHEQGRDFCSKGFREKGDGFRANPLGIALTGCPLEEHISEMNLLKAQGVPIGALAAVTVTNPMCAGTGHRICNDCMKSCIYQKQEPVNIPLVETRTLDDVLALPFGFEIYSLLTRWNPLNFFRPLPKPATQRRVLVAGLGPAGYTLSHHLLNEGHTVVAIDGLKIEPLAVPFEPIRDIAALQQSLDKRVGAGFGGVAEYGITVRWDKNYLTLLRLLLERREAFRLFGGVRFGGTLTCDDAFALGFQHVALCLGAGKPTLLDIPNTLARGVRTASDFLMGLQLTGAARADSLANLQLRLPVVVIGGGLTAIDTATEALAYYPVQVEKFLRRCESLGEETVRAEWNEEEALIAREFIDHARALRAERDAAKRERRAPNFIPLLKRWGGATIAYRKRLQDAPSYRLNHEEVEKAMEEGIFFAENLQPIKVEVNRFGHAERLRCRNADGAEMTLPAHTILLAAGTNPNTVLAREDATHFTLDGRYFRAVDEEGNPVSPERTPKPAQPQMLLHRDAQGRAVSFFGDLHPSYAGNVVKAMASAKQGYPLVSRVTGECAASSEPQADFFARLASLFTVTVERVERLTPTIVEVVVHAPQAAAKFHPGQFYRLQNFEAHAAFAMESLALTGASADPASGLISLIVLEMGGSSDLCAALKPGEPVTLMGPTGSPTEIPRGETVLLAGGGLGNAVLFSIGRAMRDAGCRVLYFAGYRHAEDRYKLDEIEAAADIVVWCCDEIELSARRPQDKSFHGNIVAAMEWYAKQGLGIGDWGLGKADTPTPNPQSLIPISDIDRIFAIGSDRMMAAVAAARRASLKPYLKAQHVALGSINSPMQCMMKEICAQCLQKHIDPVTGEESYVYSCFNQDQCLDRVDFSHLSERLNQNRLQEKLTGQWVRQLLQ